MKRRDFSLQSGKQLTKDGDNVFLGWIGHTDNRIRFFIIFDQHLPGMEWFYCSNIENESQIHRGVETALLS